MNSATILIADDEPTMRQVLAQVLASQGYDVIVATNGDELVRMAQEHMPNLLIVDLIMPGLDGYEAIRQLRNDTRTGHLPMLILTAKLTPDDVVTGFEIGADDYITKPFKIVELLARVRGHLRRATQRPVHNPLTGLAGNVLLTAELKHRVQRNAPFALLYIDLNNFKAFNDTYGFARGDRVIKMLAKIVVASIGGQGFNNDFIGHIGGDDFAVITVPERIHTICETLIAQFDSSVRDLYDPIDLERGYLTGTDRQGVLRRFPIMSISIGVVTNRYHTFADHEEVSRVAAEMKHFAKTKVGSAYVIDTRGAGPHIKVTEERRGIPHQTVLLVSTDELLTQRLAALLQSHNYQALVAQSDLDAHALLSHNTTLDLVIIDARLGSGIWSLCNDLQAEVQPPQLLAMMVDPNDVSLMHTHGFGAVLPATFNDAEFISVVQQLMRVKLV